MTLGWRDGKILGREYLRKVVKTKAARFLALIVKNGKKELTMTHLSFLL
jgi:hypothetical protein